jgi:hypothetical protein
VLDVLEPHALGKPDEDGERVGRVDEVLDLDVPLLGRSPVLFGGVDEHGQVIEQWSLGVSRVALVELDERAGDFDARRTGVGRRCLGEAVVSIPRGRFLRIGREQRDVVEVVVRVGLRLDEADVNVVTEVEERRPVLSLDRKIVRKLRECRVEVVDAQRNVLQRAALPRPFRFEEGQLALACVSADPGEALGALAHVHADVVGEEVRDPIAVFEPESDVVESLWAHGAGKDSYPTPCRETCISYLRRSNARCSFCLLNFELPEMFIRLASL